MRILTSIFIAVAVLNASCTREKKMGDDAEFLASLRQSLPARESKAGTWHFDFDTVRAYRLNWDDEDSMDGILSSGNELNATRDPTNGVLLTHAQVATLEAAVTGTHPSHAVAACIYPHHAFVFFDGEGKIVGNIDVCFLCLNYRGAPSGYAQNWDLVSIAELLQDIGMPLRNPNWD